MKSLKKFKKCKMKKKISRQNKDKPNQLGVFKVLMIKWKISNFVYY